MFGGIGIWSGGGADAASSSLDRRIADLESVKEKLDASAELFSNAVTAVVNAKNQIISNVEIANKMLDWVRDHPDIPGDEKEAAIRAGVDAVRAENAAIVATAGSQISGKPAELPEAPRPDDVLLLHGNDPKQGPAFFHASNGGQSPGTTIPLDSPRALVHVGTVPRCRSQIRASPRIRPNLRTRYRRFPSQLLPPSRNPTRACRQPHRRDRFSAAATNAFSGALAWPRNARPRRSFARHVRNSCNTRCTINSERRRAVEPSVRQLNARAFRAECCRVLQVRSPLHRNNS